jgi:hypothetical protein
VYQGTTNNDYISITTVGIVAAESYTKAGWVNKAGTGTSGSILGVSESGAETFFVSAAEVLTAGHNSTIHVSMASFPVNEWHHVAVSYDAATDTMFLYFDGELVDTAISVGSRSLLNLRLFGAFDGVNGWIGLGDDLRYYMRVLSDEEIRELYLKTRIL